MHDKFLREHPDMHLQELIGDVYFFQNNNGKLFQSLDNCNTIIPVKDGEMKYKQIKKAGELNIKYNLNGCYGYAVFDKNNICLDDRFWSLEEAENAALHLNPIKEYKVKKSVLDCKNISTAIERAKKELRKQEYHENFGQEYVTAIKDKFNIGMTYTLEDKLNMAKLSSFANWCCTYTPERENNMLVNDKVL